MGNNDLKEMDAGLMDPADRGSTNAGKICGMIACILMALGIIAGVCMLVFGVSVAALQPQ